MYENVIHDCRGIEIGVGDTIVYPGRRGSSLWLSTGVVMEPNFPSQRTLIVRRTDSGRQVEIFETARVAVVASAS